ncbi:helix-turn-helix domain-containing protein [Oxalobacter sp. OttesenSCG-928-P03]|nr:helix-turn-helix domain-containing protein [Oxalobacter sp. OttesenSCG-928-P03]
MFPAKSNEVFSDSLKSVSQEAGRQKNGKLWSNLKDVCELLRIQLSPNSSIASEESLFQHVQFKTGQRIHMIGQPFEMLYVVNSGFLKTVLIDELGNEQILSFPMKSDLLGVDGIHSKFYSSEAVALSACDLILIPFKKLTALGRTYPELENAMYSVMSRELVREQAMISMLGSLSAEGRVARFLVSLSDRFAQMGYSHRIFNLRMTRHEIGSYIGLTLETVSRTLSALHEIGWISVDQKTIEIKDIHALRNLRRLPNARTRAKDKSRAKTAEKTIIPATNLKHISSSEYYESGLRPTA